MASPALCSGRYLRGPTRPNPIEAPSPSAITQSPADLAPGLPGVALWTESFRGLGP